MKKILAIVSMAAMVAGAAFAASAGLSLKSSFDVANYDGTEFNALKLTNGQSAGWANMISFSFTGEKSGASVNFYPGANTNSELKMSSWQIWFQPLDVLKVTTGEVKPALFGQDFNNWVNKTSPDNGYGIMGSFFFGDLTIDLALAAPGTSQWAITPKGLNGIATDIKYSLGDYGTFGVAASYRNNDTDAFNKIKASVGYNSGSNLVQNLTFFLNGTFELEGSASATAPALKDVVIDGEVTYNVSSFTGKVWVPVTIGIADGVDTGVGTDVYLSYGINRVTASLLIAEANWLDFQSIEIKPGLSGPCGDLTWEVAFDAKIEPSADTPFTFSVPVGFSISF